MFRRFLHQGKNSPLDKTMLVPAAATGERRTKIIGWQSHVIKYYFGSEVQCMQLQVNLWLVSQEEGGRVPF
jgi:hypothetical protein